MHEWALLIFTICMQAAIGGTLMLAIFYKKLNASGTEQGYKLMRTPLIIIVGLSLIGLVASFSHLGTPAHAINTIRNFASSWMSREIVFTGMFIGAVVVTAGLALYQKKVNPYLMTIAAVIGLIDVFCMAAIYANSLVSGWGSINTYTSFYGTALVLGPVLVASLIVPMLKGHELAPSLAKSAFFIAIAGIAVQIIGVAVFGSSIPAVNMIAGTNALASLEGYQTTVAIRWIIEVVGIAVLGYLSLGKKKLPYSLAYVALAVLVLAEGMSRYVFYVLGA